MKTIDLTNKKINMLTVIKKLPSRNKRVYWLCKCDCGNSKEVLAQSLINNKAYSCGCIRKPFKRKTKYKNYNKRIYIIWNCIKHRCYFPNDISYKNYGGRGIKMCDEWKNDFMQFHNWAINNGYKEDLTIDRIDVNGNYEPNNCRWITKSKNSLYKRNNILIDYENKKICLKEYCRIKNISYSSSLRKYKKGIRIWEQ